MFMYFDLVRKKRLAMMDFLIAAARDGLITDLDIREQVDIFMAAVWKIFLISFHLVYRYIQYNDTLIYNCRVMILQR